MKRREEMKNIKNILIIKFKKKGFTLIEVIVAVTIVVILASLSVPKVAGYIDRAKNVKILNAGKQIYTAAMWSYSDQGNAFVKAKVLDAITSTTSITGIESDRVSIGATEVIIPFSSDSTNCSVIIQSTDSSYKVMKGINEIIDIK
jgi:type IV pilus assembly protein PilA